MKTRNRITFDVKFIFYNKKKDGITIDIEGLF